MHVLAAQQSIQPTSSNYNVTFTGKGPSGTPMPGGLAFVDLASLGAILADDTPSVLVNLFYH